MTKPQSTTLPADAPTMQRLAELQQFIADFAGITRITKLANSERFENDVDHSFGLALTCWFLAPKIAPNLDMSKILRYALAHDTVELHSGDTFVFAEQSKLDSKSDREDAAVDKLTKDWPDFPELADFAKGYKDKRDPEARFVKAVDKILPPLMINLGEKDAFWKRHKITKQMHDELKLRTIAVSDEVNPYGQKLVEWLQSPDYFYKPDEQ